MAKIKMWIMRMKYLVFKAEQPAARMKHWVSQTELLVEKGDDKQKIILY